MRRMGVKKDDVFKIISAFNVPSRMSWIIKWFNQKGIIPAENEIRRHIETLKNEGKVRITKNALGNAEYSPVEEVKNDGKEKEDATL